jgi:hypothetical protein
MSLAFRNWTTTLAVPLQPSPLFSTEDLAYPEPDLSMEFVRDFAHMFLKSIGIICIMNISAVVRGKYIRSSFSTYVSQLIWTVKRQSLHTIGTEEADSTSARAPASLYTTMSLAFRKIELHALAGPSAPLSAIRHWRQSHYKQSVCTYWFGTPQSLPCTIYLHQPDPRQKLPKTRKGFLSIHMCMHRFVLDAECVFELPCMSFFADKRKKGICYISRTLLCIMYTYRFADMETAVQYICLYVLLRHVKKRTRNVSSNSRAWLFAETVPCALWGWDVREQQAILVYLNLYEQLKAITTIRTEEADSISASSTLLQSLPSCMYIKTKTDAEWMCWSFRTPACM